MNIEQVREATTPEEMRAEIFRLSKEDPLVRNVLDSARYHGKSSEDKYTELAYYALKEAARAKQMIHDYVVLMPSPGMVIINKEKAG